jgi:O-antigen ligase
MTAIAGRSRRTVDVGAEVGSQPAVSVVAAPLALVRDPLRIALFILTIVTISRVHEHYPLIAQARPALLLVVASVGYAYLHPQYLTRANILGLWPVRVVAILGILACTSAAFGISLGGSATFILDSYAKTLAYAFLIAVSIRHVRDLFTFVWAYVISCGVLSFLAIFVFGMSKGTNSYVSRLSNLHTYDANDLSLVMMVGLPLTLLLLTVSRGTKRWFLVLVLIGISVAMARAGSRGGFLGFVAVGAAGLLLVNSVSAGRRFFAFAAVVVALAVAAPQGYWHQMRTILSPKSDFNYTDPEGRKAVMGRGIGYMMEYPIFGLGIQNFYRAECSISPKLAALRPGGPIRCTAPHNSYLQAGSELGVPGLLLWSSLVVGAVFAPLRLRRRLPRSWLRGTETERFIYGATSFFPVAMVGFAVTSFFVSFAWMDPVYFMAALLTGLYVSAKVQFEGGDRNGGGPLPQNVSRNRGAGWRVRHSAWSSGIWAARESSRPAHGV